MENKEQFQIWLRNLTTRNKRMSENSVYKYSITAINRISKELRELGEIETLIDIFGNDYETYKKNVPKLFPKLKQWKYKNKIEPLNIYKTIKTEKRTLQNIFIISAIIIYKKEIVEYLYLAL